MEFQNLARSELEIEVGPLLHHADQPLRLDLLFPHVILFGGRWTGPGDPCRPGGLPTRVRNGFVNGFVRLFVSGTF